MEADNGVNTSENEQGQIASEALKQLLQHIGELQEYFLYFVHAKLDGAKLSGQRAAVWLVLGVGGVVAGCSLMVTAIVLLLMGLAEGVAMVWDGKLWVGRTIVGSLVLLSLVGGTAISLRLWQRKSRKKKVQQYIERQMQQHLAFGRNVADHATGETKRV